MNPGRGSTYNHQMNRSCSGIKRRLIYWLVAVFCLVTLSGCVYYNTFYNARKEFAKAEKARTNQERGRRGARANVGGYKNAIDKSLKVVEEYPDSKWYDDAVHILMISYYHTGEYGKSERRAREILANFPESKFVRDAWLYQAKAKLMQGDIEEAMVIFRDLFDQDYPRQFKAEAAEGLGTFYYDNAEYAEAEPYLRALRDSLGKAAQRRTAQRMMADGYWARYRFPEARSAALQLLGMDPDRDDRYHALRMAALCSYRLQRFADGHDYLRQLMDDEVYYDSLGALHLLMAAGYEDEEDLVSAEVLYQRVIREQVRGDYRSQAFWRLGLIYQFDYDDLVQAKEYYDSTTTLGRTSEFGAMALQRSSDIGKLETFARKLHVDSTTSQAMIDEAAYTQYQLAELYWFKLNKPDTAIMEMQYVVDSFPSGFDTPKAMIALAEMKREYEADTAAADSLLHLCLERYPHSDYVPEALDALGLAGTAADTGYAEIYLRKAEDYLVDDGNVDSARYYYWYVVDSFPDSKYNLQAMFSIAWMEENYDPTGDSTIVLAYNELIDSFPSSPWARLAQERTSYRPPRRQTQQDQGDEELALGEEDTLWSDSMGEDSTLTGYSDYREQFYIRNGQKLQWLNMDPIRVEEPFEYPQSAYRSLWQGDLYFQLQLDFSGEVIDYEMMNKSGIDEIDERAEEAVAGMEFDASRIPTDLLDQWVVYKMIIHLPDHLR